jgi:metal-responsive CopG/Arc/MetJ family transcriptional regulator
MKDKGIDMDEQLTIRLPRDLGRRLRDISTRLGLNRSAIARMAIRQYLNNFKGELDDYPYERICDLIGVTKSGISDLGERHRDYLLARMRKDV